MCRPKEKNEIQNPMYMTYMSKQCIKVHTLIQGNTKRSSLRIENENRSFYLIDLSSSKTLM